MARTKHHSKRRSGARGVRGKGRMARQIPSQYRTTIPRTIQIATKRNLNQTLKFVLNQSWVLDPTVMAAGQTMNLQYGANTIFESHLPGAADGQALAYKSQDPTLYNNQTSLGIKQHADGYNDWAPRYQHFCVVGSKLTYTWEPTGTGVPCTMFAHLSGVTPAIIASTNSAAINKLPFTNRHSIASIGVSSPKSAGVRGDLKYSARSFEGVTDPDDNSNLRGRFGNTSSGGVGLNPGEQSYYNIAFAPVDPATAGKMPGGVLRVRIEYITKLKEPTESNMIQVQPRGPNANEL